MILVAGVFAGWIIGLLIHLVTKRPYRLTEPQFLWIVFLAVIPQLFAFHIHSTRILIPDQFVPIILIGSQIGLIIFSVMNLRQWPFWILTAGLVMNFAVISVNGGLMPLSPENAAWLVPNAPMGSWEIGQRFGVGKDIVLLANNTNFKFLSDQFQFQIGSLKFIYSLGDVFIAIGAFLFMLGEKPFLRDYPIKKKEITNELGPGIKTH